MVRRVNEIALNEKLTREVLLREIFKDSRDSYLIRKKQKAVIKCLESILKKEKLLVTIGDEKAIIYCLLCLWYEDRVVGFNFKRAWNKYEFEDCMDDYIIWYDEHIKQKQEELSVIIV